MKTITIESKSTSSNIPALKITNVGAVPGGECYLIDNGRSAALLDSGFAFCAEDMIANVKAILGDRPLDYVLLTHTHYDHASGSAYCRDVWPDVKCVGSEYAAKILAKESAIAVMRKMNDSAASLFGYSCYSDKLDRLGIDMVMGDGGSFDFGGSEVQVFETQGHTRCSVVFYFPSHKLLLSSETLGVLGDANSVMPCYLVGYEMSINSIVKASALDVEHALIPHSGLVSGAACKMFFNNALIAAEMFRDLVAELHYEGKSVEEITAICKAQYYVGSIRDIQPEKAYDLNASYMIPMVIAECCEK